MAMKEKSSYIIKTVVHALDVLEQFHDTDDELGVTELSRRLKLDKNNVFRLLATLASRNYIEQNNRTENYRLGLKNLQLGQTVINQMGLHRHSKQALESLAQECNETCYVSVLRGAHIINLNAVESGQPVRIVPRVGIMLPAICTAAGKVLLAGADGEAHQKRRSTADPGQIYPQDIAKLYEQKKQLDKISIQGFAFEDEELDAGVRGVAVPIRDYTRCIVGAVSISGPTMRFSEARMRDELVPMAWKAAEEISLRLGYCITTDVAV
jgi:IclR family transcriptional regulator, KDG regulon repressor